MTARGAPTSETHRRAWILWLAVFACVVAGFFAIRALVSGGESTARSDAASSSAAPSGERTERRPRPASADEPASTSSATTTAKDRARPSASGDGPTPEEEDPANDPLHQVRLASADVSDEATAKLVAELRSTDEVVVTEAANALVARHAVSAIGPIAKMDLAAAGGGGLSIIDALGKLGGMAGAGERGTAVDRLLAMLASEKERNAPESPGNLLQIYEALGDTHDPRAAGPLEVELLDPAVGRAPKVVIVKALVAIGQSSSHAALTTARAQQSKPDSDSFEEELRKELVATIDKALTEL